MSQAKRQIDKRKNSGKTRKLKGHNVLISNQSYVFSWFF